ncbi:hypothetical protein [Haloactinomyces albus]|uniref:Uncharacterized protein n=1 Tax=Haloactinomyces albus TaxID=1352928 RepID=A0AAE3ZC26_9ACTN|nr:hypothetical protein [Haloactinomyces albus]MDR7302178.1 hypothetical protein [Haloactinomyces albus]
MNRHTDGETAEPKTISARHNHERAQRNAPSRPGALRRATAAGVVGAAITAGGLAGAGQAAAADPEAADPVAVDPVAVDTCTGQAASDSFGQSIVASPEALDAKVEQATLLVFPLQFDRAEQAKKEFLDAAPVSLGSVTEKDQSFSGAQLADALAPRVANLSTLDDKADEVNRHVRNLAALGCISGADVPGQDKPDPSPSPSPKPEPEHGSESATTSAQPRTTSQKQPTARSGTPTSKAPADGAAAPTPLSGTAAPPDARSMVPSDYAYVPGSLPPWSQTRFGRAPGLSPEVGSLLPPEPTGEEPKRQTRRERIRAVGNAEALPTGKRARIALPVLLAAISLAGVTSALVRTWVLRRG